MREFNDFEARNVKFLVGKQIGFASIQITSTGMKKSILDATTPVRAYFVEQDIHDFEKQPQGQENKRFVRTYIINNFELIDTKTSFYRPNTKKGDPRIWISKIDKHTSPDDIFAIVAYKRELYIINLSTIDIEKIYQHKIENPVRDLIDSINGTAKSISNELLGLIRDKMSDWIPSEIMADTGIGRTVEKILGIPMNPSKQPDYKGIELKSKRESSKVRNTLFTQVPNWKLSRLKSGQAIVDKYGYIPEGYNHKTLHITLRATRLNSQGLGLNMDYAKNLLEANEYTLTQNALGKHDKIDNVSVWQLIDLHQRLLTKHHETFWIDVHTRLTHGTEFFRVSTIEHTKNPIPSQFDTLLEQGKISVDFLLCRRTGGDTYSFKIDHKERPLLFPESETHIINTWDTPMLK